MLFYMTRSKKDLLGVFLLSISFITHASGFDLSILFFQHFTNLNLRSDLTTLPASTDGSCGRNSAVNATCITSSFGSCCSSQGLCGTNTTFCGSGCQSAFGACDSPNIQITSTSGSCGATKTSNITCEGSIFGDCCSILGYCGGNSSYCGAGCQSAFGNCFFSAPPSNSSLLASSIVSGSSSPSLISSAVWSPSSMSSDASKTTPMPLHPSPNSSASGRPTDPPKDILGAGAKAGIGIDTAVLAFGFWVIV